MLGEKERNETPQSRRQKRELKLKTKDAQIQCNRIKVENFLNLWKEMDTQV